MHRRHRLRGLRRRGPVLLRHDAHIVLNFPHDRIAALLSKQPQPAVFASIEPLRPDAASSSTSSGVSHLLLGFEPSDKAVHSVSLWGRVGRLPCLVLGCLADVQATVEHELR